MILERLFQITAVILIGIAAYFLWKGNRDALFVSAVLGAVAFFLSIRFQVKERLKLHEAERAELEERQILQSDLLLDEDFTENAIDDEQQTTDKEKIKTSL